MEINRRLKIKVDSSTPKEEAIKLVNFLESKGEKIYSGTRIGLLNGFLGNYNTVHFNNTMGYWTRSRFNPRDSIKIISVEEFINQNNNQTPTNKVENKKQLSITKTILSADVETGNVTMIKKTYEPTMFLGVGMEKKYVLHAIADQLFREISSGKVKIKGVKASIKDSVVEVNEPDPETINPTIAASGKTILVGTTVEITDNISSHRFEIGSDVVINQVLEGNFETFYRAKDSKGLIWAITAREFKVLE